MQDNELEIYFDENVWNDMIELSWIIINNDKRTIESDKMPF